MTTFIIRRLLQSVVLLFFVSILIYLILNIVPGGPFDMLKLSNPRLGQSHIDRLNALLDLDKPLLPGKYCPEVAGEQQPCRLDQGRYLRWLGRLLQGDLGRSWTMKPGMGAEGARAPPPGAGGGASRQLMRASSGPT